MIRQNDAQRTRDDRGGVLEALFWAMDNGSETGDADRQIKAMFEARSDCLGEINPTSGTP